MDYSKHKVQKRFAKFLLFEIFAIETCIPMSLLRYFYSYFLESFRPPMFNYGVDKNAYNLGIRRNFCEVFGKNRLLWFFPVATT